MKSRTRKIGASLLSLMLIASLFSFPVAAAYVPVQDGEAAVNDSRIGETPRIMQIFNPVVEVSSGACSAPFKVVVYVVEDLTYASGFRIQGVGTTATVQSGWRGWTQVSSGTVLQAAPYQPTISTNGQTVMFNIRFEARESAGQNSVYTLPATYSLS